MGLGPNIIIRGFEEENYLAPMSALVAAGIMNTARLFIGRMRTVRDIVSVDSITFMVSAPGKGNRVFIDTSATLRGPCGRNTLLVSNTMEVISGTSWEVELANKLTEATKASISLELRTVQKSAKMLEHAIKERFQLFPV